LEVRLENGHKEFASLREELRLLRTKIEQVERDSAPKPMSRPQILALVFGPLLIVGGFVWNAARYPDRGEFDQAQQAAEDAARQTERKLFALEQAQALQAADLKAIAGSTGRHDTALDKIDQKLDRVLAGKGK
jgi:uncharacterized coiled-coil protein SlyX